MPGDLEDEGDAHVASAIAARLLPGATPLTKPTNEELVAICQAFVEQLRNGTAPWVVQRLHNTYGPMPTDHYSFSFWMALVRLVAYLKTLSAYCFLTFRCRQWDFVKHFPTVLPNPGVCFRLYLHLHGLLLERDWPAYR